MEDKHKSLLKRNHRKLSELTSEEIGKVLDYLWEHDIINKSMRERVALITKTPTEQASSLLYMLPTRGRFAFQAFVDALEDASLYEAADILDPGSAPRGPTYNPAHSTTSAPVLEDSEDEELPDVWPLPIAQKDAKVTVRTCLHSKNPEKYERLYERACGPAGQRQYYQMLHGQRGLCLIINNEEFQFLENRDGTNADMADLNSLFSGLGFDVDMHRNKTAREMQDLLVRKVEDRDHSDSDCFVLFVLTHGEKGVLFGTHGYLDKAGNPHDFLSVDMLRDFVCGVKTLMDKPKLIFLQACRGSNMDKGMSKAKESSSLSYKPSPVSPQSYTPISDSETEVISSFSVPDENTGSGNMSGSQEKWQSCPGEGAAGSAESPECDMDMDMDISLKPGVSSFMSSKGDDSHDDVPDAAGEKKPSLADSFLFNSTTEGIRSWRNTETGTWFIQAVVYVFSRFAYKHEICNLMKKVICLVSKAEEGGNKQIPEPVPMFEKDFYFFPKLAKLD